MHLQNYTPFCGLAWQNIDPKNEIYVTVFCRIKFLLKKTKTTGEWKLQVSQHQGDPFIKDIHYDNNTNYSVRYESDLVPVKMYTDIVVNAKSYNIFSESKWSCSVAVHDLDGTRLNYSALEVKDRVFRKTTPHVDIRYEKSKGGIVSTEKGYTKEEGYIYDPYNPVGCGRYTLNDCRVQLDYIGKTLKHIPAGFGFIHRSWKSRLDYAGTYDEQWEKEQAPLLPLDFQPYYYQAAHPFLITKKYLQGGEKITLTQLMKEDYQNTFTIPVFRFLSRIHTPTQVIDKKMNMDTVVIDIYDEDIEAYHVYITWRSYTKIYDEGLYAELIYVPTKENKNVQ